jgi:hypothetical protein
MKAGLNEEEEEEEEEGVLKMEEWDNLRPRKWELNGVEGSDEVFWKDGRWGRVEKELVGRVREGLAMDDDEEEQSGNILLLLCFEWVGEIWDRKR